MQQKKIEQNFSHICYISKELSVSPLIPAIISFSKTVDNYLRESSQISSSISFGNRVLFCLKKNDKKNVDHKDIIEIVDIDPIKKNILLIGKKQPEIKSIVHWIIHKARTDINAIVEIEDPKIYEKFSSKIPIIKNNPNDSIERVKIILQNLQNNKNICIEDETIFLTGVDLKEIEEYLIKNLRESK